MLRLEFVVGLVVILCLLIYALVLTIIGYFEGRKKPKVDLTSIEDQLKR